MAKKKKKHPKATITPHESAKNADGTPKFVATKSDGTALPYTYRSQEHAEDALAEADPEADVEAVEAQST